MEDKIKQILKKRLGDEMSDFTIDALVHDLQKFINLEKRVSFEEGYAHIITKGK